MQALEKVKDAEQELLIKTHIRFNFPVEQTLNGQHGLTNSLLLNDNGASHHCMYCAVILITPFFCKLKTIGGIAPHVSTVEHS